MKQLNGRELAEYIKERQAHEVRALRQAWHILPKLAVVTITEAEDRGTSVAILQQYAEDILVDVDMHAAPSHQVATTVESLNTDLSVHGIFIQAPEDVSTQLAGLIVPDKDVDAVGDNTLFDAAIPLAVLWLLAGYNIEVQRGRRVLLVGHGRTADRLAKMLQESEVNVQVMDQDSPSQGVVLQADVIIVAADDQAVVTAEMIPEGATVIGVGAGVASDVYERSDLAITPQKDGIEPLAVCALFDNVIRAARQQAHESAAPQ